MISINRHPGTSISWQDSSLSFFSGFSYLSLESLVSFKESLKKGIDLYGCVFPSSRISNVQLALYDQFEEKLSAFTGFPACCTFPSGFQASQAAVMHAGNTSLLLFSPNCHPALRSGFPSGIQFTRKEWPEAAVRYINSDVDDRYTLVSDSLNPLHSEVYSFDFLHRLKRRCRLVLDDSHGIGLLGTRGEGCIAQLPKLPNCSYMIAFSLAKAFAIQGGAIAGSQEEIRELRTFPVYTASTALPPAGAYAWLENFQHIDFQRNLLFDRVQFLESRLPAGLFDHDPRLPIFASRSAPLYTHLLNRGMVLSSFPYPRPSDPPITRIVVQAGHSPEQLERLAACLDSFKT